MPKGIYQRKSIEQRFWEKVEVKENHECWLWLGSKDKDGYGWFSYTNPDGCKDYRSITAHRYSLMMKLQNFELPPEVLTRHTCDTPSCVNPNHLIEGSAKENSADMTERNRQAFGEKNPAAKLTEEIAKKILEEYTTDVQSGRKYGSHLRLAEKYSVDKQVINRLISGKTWKHLHPK